MYLITDIPVAIPVLAIEKSDHYYYYFAQRGGAVIAHYDADEQEQTDPAFLRQVKSYLENLDTQPYVIFILHEIVTALFKRELKAILLHEEGHYYQHLLKGETVCGNLKQELEADDYALMACNKSDLSLALKTMLLVISRVLYAGKHQAEYLDKLYRLPLVEPRLKRLEP